jgi:RNA polymerase sigma factor (sigma-70 family)
MSTGSEWDRLLLAARGGDSFALGNLVDVASEDLRTVAAGVLGPAARVRLPADDVFAEAMLAALREIGRLRATNYIGFRYWFASIARNQVRRALRDQKNKRETARADDGAEDDLGEVALVLDETNEPLVRLALLRMPRTQQIAYVLRDGLGLAWRSIGFVLGRRATAAARLIHYRAVLRLKELAGTVPEFRKLTIRA